MEQRQLRQIARKVGLDTTGSKRDDLVESLQAMITQTADTREKK